MRITDGRKNNLTKVLNNIEAKRKMGTQGYRDAVEGIIAEVVNKGDEGLKTTTLRYDSIDLDVVGIRVSQSEIDEGWSRVDGDFKKALRKAIKNISSFHEKQREKSWFTSDVEGVILGQRVTPINRTGIYVPGGTAAYPSSVLMNGIPPLVARVKEVAMVTPPMANGEVNAGVLAAAKELGITEIYRIGGAQAIAALAYGTPTVKAVDKIVGPGNIYVATAKALVYGQVDIDMVAGPSEVLVIADKKANPVYVAADLLSQAEHDVLASAICITNDEELATRIEEEVMRQLEALERKEIARESIINNGEIILVETLEEAFWLSNGIAPEHLEICVEDPFQWLSYVKNAGAIFLGKYSPEALGDYIAGPNHVLPTNGTARFSSPLSVNDFVKKSSIIYYSKGALEEVKDEIMVMAQQEALTAHKNAIKVRFQENG
ncbi:histidinol dehydrogenase [Alkaliphilus serpentinus]|uniref:Histidinol dehydrogenase n=1 Tax=Alkaliphilus serpentinus TaxID=1482731 RepID=A0A833M970_9FIRM|nr:histidinol dehydrogenase [Alkaliphilus serpentinus]KAB3532722.1 histidinol dehydrogenase [Alkaliphilus serpentinus]